MILGRTVAIYFYAFVRPWRFENRLQILVQVGAIWNFGDFLHSQTFTNFRSKNYSVINSKRSNWNFKNYVCKLVASHRITGKPASAPKLFDSSIRRKASPFLRCGLLTNRWAIYKICFFSCAKFLELVKISRSSIHEKYH